eukprot:261545_1
MLSRFRTATFKPVYIASQYGKLTTAHFSTSPERKTALVTGGNRGIGLRACEHLCDSGFNVIMTSRNLDSGKAVIKENFSKDRSDKISLLQLDISDPSSITNTVKYIEQNVDKIDVLVNNAGIHYNYTPFTNTGLSKPEKIANTLVTNFVGTLSLTEQILPQLKDARIICLSNRDSALRKLSPELRNEFLRDGLDEQSLIDLMERYKKDALSGDHIDDKDIVTTKCGWINSYYLMSYVGVNTFCRILGNRFQTSPQNNNWIGSYCPGHCATDSTEFFGERKPSESAMGIQVLSTMMLNEFTPNGSFWAAFYPAGDLDAVDLQTMDLTHPTDTMSWDVLCDTFVSDPKIQAYE